MDINHIPLIYLFIKIKFYSINILALFNLQKRQRILIFNNIKLVLVTSLMGFILLSEAIVNYLLIALNLLFTISSLNPFYEVELFLLDIFIQAYLIEFMLELV